MWPRLTASDATPEAMVTLLAQQGGRIAAISAEAGIFTSLTGRYTKAPNLDPILTAHAGDAILVDRRGREPERVESPALTLLASIQPYALRELVDRPDFGGRRLLARILWALPVDNTGHRDVEPPEMPERDREAYRALVYDLALSMAARDTPVRVTLTEQARKVHLDYHRTVEARLRRGRELGADLVREWGSKLAGAVARIAGCLHAASAPLDQPISEATMRAAVALGDYYQVHAVAALAGGDDKETSDARTLLAYLVDKGLTRFNLRDLQRTGPKSMRKAAQLKPVLDTLTLLGWIREHQNGGWELHPHAARLLKAGDTGDNFPTIPQPVACRPGGRHPGRHPAAQPDQGKHRICRPCRPVRLAGRGIDLPGLRLAVRHHRPLPELRGTPMTDTYLIAGDDGEPLAVADMKEITDAGTAFAFAMAAHCDDSAALDRIAVETIDRVGPGAFGYVCADALRVMAQEILSPSFDLAKVYGTDLRAGMKAIAEGRNPGAPA